MNSLLLTRNARLFLSLFVVGAAALLLLHTPRFSVLLLAFTCFYAALVFFRDLVVKADLHSRTGVCFMLLQAVLAVVLCVWSQSYFAQIYVLILIGEFAFHHARFASLLFTVAAYAAVTAGMFTYRQYSSFAEELYVIFPRVIDYAAIYGMSVLAKIAYQQRNQLADDNERLRIASVELERKAKLQERTRISREIHDSVGHMLTSALTGLQTAEYAMENAKYTLAMDMIHRTRQNILNGLNDVRSSVHLLRESFPDHSFIPELVQLLQETNKQTRADITYEIDPGLPDLSPKVELAIYRAVQEGITNGIRHGASTAFRFILRRNGDMLLFELSDNGKPPERIQFGFGLNAMKERVEDVGGQLTVVRDNSGVRLEISIPLQNGNAERG